jgi:hypothetical protein
MSPNGYERTLWLLVTMSAFRPRADIAIDAADVSL